MEWLFVLIGFVTGFAICNAIFGCYYKSEGTLRIDHSHLKKDIQRIQTADLDRLSKKKPLALKVDNNANLSQE